ncbi:ThiF family adenylyltransferase [Mesorhizobium japonicum]|uniref:Mlr6140 protein n=1 Tax=Mesorhizobium japonicum (strain LMG 29417 / CECT 9101 / MAFF 303099) TaxID=266835 RepID=Q98A59_RHILO|nr:ThiF family adenylyltransferase [Mesorhizobium japonicum]BAB52478.1 mlr6140 [Mesorhizobium japonicum MAFF 303099]
MSADLISRDPHLKRLLDEGFELEMRELVLLLVHSVPYVKRDKSLGRGTLVCTLSLDTQGLTASPQTDHTMWFTGETPCHRDGAPMTNIIHNSNEATVGSDIKVHHYFSSKPEGTGQYANIYDKVVTYESHLGAAARSHDKTANARTGVTLASAQDDSPFAIPDSASARYGIVAANRKLRGRVAIIGLGGTGAYLLDLAAKTRVAEIHLYDDDQLLNHNLFRSPGAPEPVLAKNFPRKVDYYAALYARMHKGVKPHPTRVKADNIDEFAGYDFVFVCVDKGSSRRVIAEGLVRLGIPFVDTGIGLGLEHNTLDGCARATFIAPGTPWAEVATHLSFGDDDEEADVYGTEIQTAELNSLNAIMAIMRWKRWLTFYRDERNERNATYMIEGNNITNRGA